MLNFPSTWQVVGDIFPGGTDLTIASLIGVVKEVKRLSMMGRKTGNQNGSSVKALAQDATKAGCVTDSIGLILKLPILMGKEA